MFNKKILLYNFSQSNDDVLKELEKEYDVTSVDFRCEQLYVVGAAKPDLIILNIDSEFVDSITSYKLLTTANNSVIPIILLIPSDVEEHVIANTNVDIDDYITKPFTEGSLIRHINIAFKRLEKYRGANPLTGLPGNVEIQREINNRINRNEPFAAIYADLDNFKAYNDVYGFVNGDNVIKMTAEILSSCINIIPCTCNFIGHIGGDDFVVLTSTKFIDQLCMSIIYQFDKFIQTMYNKDDLENSCISLVDRHGVQLNFPIMSISLAVVINYQKHFESSLDLARTAAEVKHKVKLMNGSNYFIDRRVK